MRSVYWQFIGLIGVAIVLLVLDRFTRIQPLITGGVGNRSREGFQMPVLFGNRVRACGVDLEPCPEPTKCGNGLCISTNPVPLQEKMPLPVLPPPTPTFQ